MFDLTGRTALVTGAGQNVGAGIARALGTAGATVLVNDLRPGRADEIVEALVADGVAAVAVPFDVTDRAAIDAAVAESGPIDVLVNNAGNGGAEAMLPKKFAATDPSDWLGPMEINLHGVLHCCHAVLPGMVERGHGRIITISSAAGTHGVGMGFVPYSGGKGGPHGLLAEPHVADDGGLLLPEAGADLLVVERPRGDGPAPRLGERPGTRT